MRQLVVTAGIIVENQKILMAQRHSRDSEGGKWEFPGGKVELGEDPRLGLQRELWEELGIEVKVGRIWEVISVLKEDLHLILLYFGCELVRGIPKAIDCQQVGWLTCDEVAAREKPAADEAFWEKHRQELSAFVK